MKKKTGLLLFLAVCILLTACSAPQKTGETSDAAAKATAAPLKPIERAHDSAGDLILFCGLPWLAPIGEVEPVFAGKYGADTFRIIPPAFPTQFNKKAPSLRYGYIYEGAGEERTCCGKSVAGRWKT